MLKTPSVTINFMRAPSASFSFSSRSGKKFKTIYSQETLIPDWQGTPLQRSITIIILLIPADCVIRDSKKHCGCSRHPLERVVNCLSHLPAISLFLYLNFLALHNRTPSIIDAWFSSSLRTASSGLKRASNKPVFASKQQGYKIASSRSWNLDIFSSSSLWISCEY